jgi:hypothetical protein
MQELVGAIAEAFFRHHACIRHGGELDTRSSGSRRHCCSGYCPCHIKFGWSKIKSTRSAITRGFKPGDTITTFNWDVLIESLLWQAGTWGMRDGYGVDVDVDFDSLELLGANRQRLEMSSPIKVLKAHGSINWLRSVKDRRIGLIEVWLFGLPASGSFSSEGDEDIPEWPYVEQAILTPTYLKDYSMHDTLAEVWDQIVLALEQATEITVVGYSLPRGDSSARAMLSHALRRNDHCKAVNVVSRNAGRDSNWSPFLDAVEKEANWLPCTFEQWVRRL